MGKLDTFFYIYDVRKKKLSKISKQKEGGKIFRLF